MSGGIYGDYKQPSYYNMFSNLPPEIAQQTGYDPVLKAQTDKFMPNRFMAMLQHLGAGGTITEPIAANSQVQAHKVASQSKQETLNAQMQVALERAHYDRMSNTLSRLLG